MTGRRAGALVLLALMASACAQRPDGAVAQPAVPTGSRATIVPTTTVPTTTVPVTTLSTTTVPVTTAPAITTCPGITVVVFGNSIDAELDSEMPPWPILMEALLRAEPEFSDLDVVDRAAPGSMIIGPSPYDDGPMSRLVTAIPEVMREYSTLDKARTVVLIDPSFGEISDITAADTDESVVARAVAGIQQSLLIAHAEGVAAVIVMPMGPVTDGAEFLQKFPMNRRISAVNAALSSLGIVPASMPVSPLINPSTGFGDWKYFDDFVSDGPFMVGVADGVHPDADGHAALAAAMANLVELRSAFAQLC